MNKPNKTPLIIMLTAVGLLVVFIVGYSALKTTQTAQLVVTNVVNNTNTLGDNLVVSGETYTFAQAGIVEGFDADLTNLAYIEEIYQQSGQTYITFDPVTYVDCRGLRSTNQALPEGCGADAGVVYLIDNGDKTESTMVLAKTAGPYFISYNDSDQVWKTMNTLTLGQALTGTLPLSTAQQYYSPDLHSDISLFHVVQTNNVVTKVIQKYFE